MNYFNDSLYKVAASILLNEGEGLQYELKLAHRCKNAYLNQSLLPRK